MASFQWVKEPTPLSHVSPSFIFPEQCRAHSSPFCAVPVVDLNGGSTADLAAKVSAACEEFGIFHVVNHGVSGELCAAMTDATRQLFEAPREAKEASFSDDPNKAVRLYNRKVELELAGSGRRKVALWSEVFFHPWGPSVDFATLLPNAPHLYRTIVAEYAKEIDKLFTRILSSISLGLGLDKDHLERTHGQNPRRKAQANYYPPCPDPGLTLGLFNHTDPGTLTIVQQLDQVPGLQIIKDGRWASVKLIPDSFMINVGDQLQVLSNGRYKSLQHRAVANKHDSRTSLAFFLGPDNEVEIGPIRELVDEEHPALYRRFRYADFMKEYHRQDDSRRCTKEVVELNV